MGEQRVLMHGQFLVDLMTTGNIPAYTCRGLPKGTKLSRIVESFNREVWLIVEHESFPQVKDGDTIPIFPQPVFEKL